MQYLVDSYKEKHARGEIKRPGDVAPVEGPERRKWLRDFAEHIYTRWCVGQTVITPGGYIPSLLGERSIAEARAYGRGRQSVAKYQAQWDTSKIKGPDGNPLRLVNFSWDLHRVYTTFRERGIDRLMEREYEPSVVALDAPSRREKELRYLGDRLAAMPQAKQLFQAVGRMPEGVSEDVMQMDVSDIDIVNQIGGYKTLAEMTLGEAAQATLELSDWSPALRRQVLEDLWDFGIMAADPTTERLTGRQILKYIDPELLILPTSKYDDGRDIDHYGVIETMTISQLRQASNFTEEELLDIAKCCRSYGGNTLFKINLDSYDIGRTRFQQRLDGDWPYDNFQIPVLNFKVVALDVERYIMGQRPEGNKVFDPVRRDAELSKKDEKRGKEVKDEVIQYVYQGSWIIGTNHLFNDGICDLVTRQGVPGAMKATLPLVTFRLNQTPITEACIGAIDDLQMALYRLRHARTTIPPPPDQFVDMSKLEDSVQIGSLNLDPLDMIDIYRITGYFFGASKSEFAGVGEAANGRPMFPMGSAVAEYMMGLRNDIMGAIQELRLISGANEMTDGTGSPKDVLNGVAQTYEQASNRALSIYYTANESFFKSIVKRVVQRYQALSAFGERALTYIPVGSDVARMIMLYPDFALNEVDIVVRPGLDNMSKQMLMQSLKENRDLNKVDEATYLWCMTLIQQGQVDRARFVMAKAVQQMQMQMQQADIAKMKAQSEAQAQAAAAMEAEKQKTAALQYEGEAKLVVLKGEEDRKTKAMEIGWEREKALTQPATTG